MQAKYKVLTASGAPKIVKGTAVLHGVHPTLQFAVWYNRSGKIYTVSELNTGRAIASGYDKQAAIDRARSIVEKHPAELIYLLKKQP